MPYLVAAVVLFGVLSVLNLLLTFGILRRMRADAAAGPQAPAGAGDMFALKPGATVPDFQAVTTRDEPVTRESAAGVVAFFSADCDGCHDLLPSFLERAGALGRENVLAVFGGDEPETVAELEKVARVVQADRDGGAVSRAFQNEWTPALYLLGEDGRITGSGARMHELPLHTLPVPASGNRR
ncbi:peroxiredoxin family protein [Actinomadura harenae]|uniref:TlpA family protein disulfide reductase n=1 Tax=Actinomadura harenae TaxID=2483351 RepID=A0A3M2LXE0_9ACTN|nr:TlpA family protein disulfide reductase [Actinomadura harenae]RMI42007.1 TlpA family protein disulfide reductase [Actinomadura harenae]